MANETFQLLGSIGEFVGGLLVAVTIIFLIFQIRQNTRALRSTAAEYSGDTYRTMAIAVVQSPQFAQVLWRARHGEALEPEEREQLGWFLMASLKTAETQHVKWRDGLLSDEIYEPVKGNMEGFVRSFPTFMPRWWEASRESFSQEFRELIDTILAEPVR